MKAGYDEAAPTRETTPVPWVVEAARRPVAFAQVREDAALDQWVVDRLGTGAKVLLVASGGCTAALAASRPNVLRLHLIDPNAAQIALARLKLRLLATSSTGERLSLLGHASMPVTERQRRLTTELETLDLSPGALGPIHLIAEQGPDHAGRYELLFAKLREELRPVADELTAALELRDPAEQLRRVDPSTKLGRALDAAFDTVMALPNLVGLFGEGAIWRAHDESKQQQTNNWNR